jgi:hypothetical protein
MAKEKNRLVVGSAEWADSIPEWLLEEVRAERLILGMCSIRKELAPEDAVGEAETAVYLMTASFRQPLSSEHTNIYVYLTAKLMKRKNGEDKPLDPMLEEALTRGLTDGEKDELRDLKRMIYDKRGGEIDSPILNMLKAMKKAA